jgi:hypothetical protein
MTEPKWLAPSLVLHPNFTLRLANTLAYYNSAKITAVKSFITQALGFDI